MKKHDGKGLLFAAFGQECFLKECEQAVISYKEQMPDLPTALVTDMDYVSANFDAIKKVRPPDTGTLGSRGGFANKIYALKETPFERTLFVDSDTFCAEPVYDLFDLLQLCDVAAAHAPLRGISTPRKRLNVANANLASIFPAWNTGVMVFSNSDATSLFLHFWRDLLVNRHNQNDSEYSDQTIAREAVACSGVHLLMLPVEYNLRVSLLNVVSGRVRILHGRPRPRGLGQYARLFNSVRGVRLTWGSMGLIYLRDNQCCYRSLDDPEIERQMPMARFRAIWKEAPTMSSRGG